MRSVPNPGSAIHSRQPMMGFAFRFLVRFFAIARTAVGHFDTVAAFRTVPPAASMTALILVSSPFSQTCSRTRYKQ